MFQLPAYALDFNAFGNLRSLWSHVKDSLAGLACGALDRLDTLVRDRLKRLHYYSNVLDGFLAASGLNSVNRRSHPGMLKSAMRS
ncbi:transposase [Streptomyces sp. NPDC052101]|uniref:transposase n=1 Tax=Streptomyces sp. NPDC052101 TaxID=3155763 RepID=UPI003449B6F7